MQLQRASNGAPVALGEELGSGGEGTVYPVVDAPEFVAKIYFEPPETAKAAKLSAMTRLAPPELLRIAAWPTELLLDENGAVRGFLMQRVSSREDAHELYSPKSRRYTFPDADFRFIVHAAANVARAFAQLHSLGHIIGDVNHGNALVGRDATVILIDCDSFQVKDGEASFACDVGVPLFTPPELQGRNFRGLSRSTDHDAFGLAILLFHFLYVGRHPYAGLYADGEMPIEQAIAESRFAFGANAVSRGMSAPPGTLALDVFGAPVAALFERAFAVPGTSVRPTAIEWAEAMNSLEGNLTACTTSPDHDHPKGTTCCWCELEGRTSMVLFGNKPRRAAPFLDRTELDRLWDEIAAVDGPLELGVYQAKLASRMADEAFKSTRAWTIAWWFVYILLVVFSAEAAPRRYAEEWVWFCVAAGVSVFIATRIRRRSKPLRKTLLREAEERISDQTFVSARAKLVEARRRLLQILDNPWFFRSGAATTLSAPRALKLNAVERAGLLSLGIVSAADVLHKRSQLHHALTYARVREIIQWAESCGSKAVADTVTPLEAHELRAVDEALRTEARGLMTEMRRGAASLKTIRDQILTARRLAAVEFDSSPTPP